MKMEIFGLNVLIKMEKFEGEYNLYHLNGNVEEKCFYHNGEIEG